MLTRTEILAVACCVTLSIAGLAAAHGTVVSPTSRVYRVYQANPSNPSFQLAANAVAIDGELSYYTWNEVSRNIPEAVQAGLPPAFDYSPWVPDGQLASAGRVDPASPDYPRTHAGLDQVSSDWPTTPVTAGETIQVDFLVTAVHSPSVWDVWMTAPDWDPATALNWSQMEFLGRPQPILAGGYFTFDQLIPDNRRGHHVLWIAWQRDDPAGEVFFSTSDIQIEDPSGPGDSYCVSAPHSDSPSGAAISALGSQSVAANDLILRAWPAPQGQPGIFFHGSAQTQLPFGDGFRCVDANLLRIGPPAFSDLSGAIVIPLDNTTPAGAGVVAGATRHFQAWFRDPAAGGANFNFSDALSITFTP